MEINNRPLSIIDHSKGNPVTFLLIAIAKDYIIIFAIAIFSFVREKISDSFNISP